MSSTRHVLRVELYDSPSRVNGARLHARLLVNGTTLQTSHILTTSAWPKLFKDINWYLEEYIYSDAFAFERACTVETDFRHACRRLAIDLELGVVLSQSPFTSLDHVELQIVNNAEELYDTVYAFPWELLEHTDIWSDTRKSIIVSRLILKDAFKGQVADGTLDDDLPDIDSLKINDARDISQDVVRDVVAVENKDSAETPINILLVLARAADTLDGRPRDIPPFVALEAITKLSDRLAGIRRLNVEVARPGTWASVKQSLAKHPSGYYSLVHFDVHGGTRAKAPSLSFADPDGSGRLKKEFVATVARALKKAAVQNVVLNACGSASNAYGADANPAHIFLQHGVSSVVGMSHRASAQAMTLFLKHFYEELVTSSSFSAATAVGRQVLSDNKTRRTNQQVDRDLSDYMLPVLYTSDVLSASLTSTGMEPEDPAELAPESRSTYIEGRDFDILRLENSLQDHRIVCLLGSAGVGKSFLLRRAEEVWEQTGLFDTCVYIDLLGSSVKSLERFLHILKLAGPSESPSGIANRRLVIIDNVHDALMLTAVEQSRQLPKTEWARIQLFIASYTTDKYILASRSPSVFIENIVSKANTFQLNGFHPLDSLTLLRRELGSQSSQWSADDRQSAGLLLDMLQHNPVAIHLMVPWITSLKIGIHEFFEGIIDWRFSTESSGYWQALGREQFQITCLVDISRCYSHLDFCGHFAWLWIALFWDHGPQVSTMLTLIDTMTPEVNDSKQRAEYAVKLGEEHGLFVVTGSGGFIRHVNPLFTIWMRYCLLHALRVLRDVEPDSSEGGTFHTYMSIGNWRTIMSGNNPLRLECGDAVSSMFSAEMKKGYEAQYGALKAYWAGVFSDTIVDFKDSTDFQEKGERTREMRFNYLGCFNTLMGSQYVLDQARMQFLELRLFWMMLREHVGDHETALHARKILQLMDYMTSHLDLSKLEYFRTEAAIGILLMPVQKASLTNNGMLPIHHQMFRTAEKIWKSCELRYGANIPHHIALQRPFLQMLGNKIDGKAVPEIKDVKEMFAETFDHLAKAMPEGTTKIEHGRQRWLSWVDQVSNEIGTGDFSLERLQSAMEGMREFNPVAFDNPFDALVQDHQVDEDKVKWSQSLTDALQVENFTRACKFLKLMIPDALRRYEWDKARKLLDIFWELKPKHTTLSAEDLQDFVDYDATTSVQWELEQCYVHDAPADGLRAAFEHAKRVHSAYDSASNPFGDNSQNLVMMEQMIPLMEQLFASDFVAAADTKTALRRMASLAEQNPWILENSPSWGRTAEMLDLIELHESTNKQAGELIQAADYQGARDNLRLSMKSLIKMYHTRQELLPDVNKGGDVPEDLRIRKSHFDALTAYGVAATGHAVLGVVPFQTAFETLQEALSVATEMDGASLSELPLGYASSIRQTRSYMLEVKLVIQTSEDDLSGAMKICQELLGVLTAVAPDLPPMMAKKVQWYRDVNARLGAYYHARRWRTLTDSFQPHLAKLQLKRIGVLFGDMNFEGPIEDPHRFWTFGMAMSACTGLQLDVLCALGPVVGNNFWQRCRAVMPYDWRSDFMADKFVVTEVIYMQGFLEITAADID